MDEISNKWKKETNQAGEMGGKMQVTKRGKRIVRAKFCKLTREHDTQKLVLCISTEHVLQVFTDGTLVSH
jgi:hypothetical protein